MKQIITSDNVKKGEIFKVDGNTWLCTDNDGFILNAKNTDPKAVNYQISYIGLVVDVEVDR